MTSNTTNPWRHEKSMDQQLLDELDRALEERRALLLAHAAQWARYGRGGTFTVLRNHAEAKLKCALRAEQPDWTEQQLKDAVSASPKWKSALDRLEEGRTQYFKERAELDLSAQRLELLSARLRLMVKAAPLDDEDLGAAVDGTGEP